MMADSHAVLGCASWVIVAKLSQHADPVDPVLMLMAGGAALLPDLDHPKSWLGQRLGIISMAVASMFGHRGITHSLFAVAACVFALRWWGVDWPLAPLVVGYLSHLAADALTPSGVPLLWPIRYRFRIPFARTASWRERGLVILVATYSVVLGIT